MQEVQCVKHHKIFMNFATSVLDDAHVAGVSWCLVLPGTRDQGFPCTKRE